MTEEEREAGHRQFLEEWTEEEQEAALRVSQFIDFADYGRRDMPDGTIITDAYYSDMLVPVALKSFVEFLQSVTAGQ